MWKPLVAAFLWMLVGIMIGSFLEQQADVARKIEAAKAQRSAAGAITRSDVQITIQPMPDLKVVPEQKPPAPPTVKPTPPEDPRLEWLRRHRAILLSWPQKCGPHPFGVYPQWGDNTTDPAVWCPEYEAYFRRALRDDQTEKAPGIGSGGMVDWPWVGPP
jgi:hypothetical protein